MSYGGGTGPTFAVHEMQRPLWPQFGAIVTEYLPRLARLEIQRMPALPAALIFIFKLEERVILNTLSNRRLEASSHNKKETVAPDDPFRTAAPRSLPAQCSEGAIIDHVVGGATFATAGRDQLAFHISTARIISGRNVPDSPNSRGGTSAP
jgi:hypothetical protein